MTLDRFRKAEVSATPEDDDQATVLLVTRDRDVQRWGPRWLQRYGCQVHVVDEGREVHRQIGAFRPRVVMVDAALLEEVLASLGECSPEGEDHVARPRLFAICANDKQVKDVLDRGVVDVMRRPFNWALAARRVELILETDRVRGDLVEARHLLEQARSRVREERERLEQLNRADRVTGLPNLRVFTQVLERALGYRRSHGGTVAVLHVDLNRFRSVNEILGRQGGDRVLQEVAARLERLLRRSDVLPHQQSGLATAVVARSSGVNFHVLLGHAGEPGEVARFAGAILEALAAPHDLGGTEIYLSPSVGIAVAPTDGDESNQLLHHAESAMYEARRQGPGAYRFFSPSLGHSSEQTLHIDQKLRKALANDDLEVYYQPLVALATGRVVGVEALLRWRNDELGQVPPGEFIPIAEDTGQMVAIGEWVLRTACLQLRRWLDDGLPAIRMSVNVSRCQLTHGGFAHAVRRALEDSALDPGLLVLELSERGVLSGEQDVLDQLRELKALGVLLAVDDFGTGNSAISYLRGLELDILKIDRCYISGLLDSDDDASIASAMIAMAHKLRLEVVAEGAEAEEQLVRLRAWGCDEFQGFVFSPALPERDLRLLIAGLPAGSVGVSGKHEEGG